MPYAWHASRLRDAGPSSHVAFWPVGSTGRRNTCIKSFCWGFNSQGFTWPFVELTHHLFRWSCEDTDNRLSSEITEYSIFPSRIKCCVDRLSRQGEKRTSRRHRRSVENDRAARLAAIPAGESPRQQRCYGAAARIIASIGADMNRWSTPMQKLNDLSRCLTPLEPDSTLIASPCGGSCGRAWCQL